MRTQGPRLQLDLARGGHAGHEDPGAQAEARPRHAGTGPRQLKTGMRAGAGPRQLKTG